MAKVDPKLICHRDVARLLGVSTTLLRRWIARGVFPQPHSAIEETLFYPKHQIDHYVTHGEWPDPGRRSSHKGEPPPLALTNPPEGLPRASQAARTRPAHIHPTDDTASIKRGREAALANGSALAREVYALNDRRVSEKLTPEQLARALGAERRVHQIINICRIFDYCDPETVSAVLAGEITTVQAGCRARASMRAAEKARLEARRQARAKAATNRSGG
jgi:hypothetical protein